MSDYTHWAIEEMTRAICAERLAEAEQLRLVAAAQPTTRSLRVVLAEALRSLAGQLDRDGTGAASGQHQTDRPLARAC